MEKALSILALLFSTASAIWLLANEIRERHIEFNRRLKRKDLVDRRKLLLADIADINKLLHAAFKDVDPSGEKERQQAKEDTLYFRQKLEAVEADLEKANEDLLSFEDAGPSGAQVYPFLLLLAGFVLQLIAEVLRPC